MACHWTPLLVLIPLLCRQVKSLLERLDKFEKASNYKEPLCTPISAPDKGAVYVV